MLVERRIQSMPWKPATPMIRWSRTIASWTPRFSSACLRAARMKASESATVCVWLTNGIQFARCKRLASISSKSASASPSSSCRNDRPSPSSASSMPGVLRTGAVVDVSLLSPPVFGDLDHVGFIVSDFDEAAAWVREVLGLPFTRTAPLPQYGIDAAFFGRGSGTLEIFTLTDADLLEQRLEGRARRLDHVAYRVDDLAATTSTLRASGARFCTPDRRQELSEPLEIGSARCWTGSRDHGRSRPSAHRAVRPLTSSTPLRARRSRRSNPAASSRPARVPRVKNRRWSARGSK